MLCIVIFCVNAYTTKSSNVCCSVRSNATAVIPFWLKTLNHIDWGSSFSLHSCMCDDFLLLIYHLKIADMHARTAESSSAFFLFVRRHLFPFPTEFILLIKVMWLAIGNFAPISWLTTTLLKVPEGIWIFIATRNKNVPFLLIIQTWNMNRKSDR